MNKYRNRKTTADGITFDSRKEAERYWDLKLLEKCGKITGLTLQPRYELLPSIKWNGQTLRKRSYVADFKYMEGGKLIVEDVKSAFTRKNPVYTLKRHIFLAKYIDIEFREVI